MKKKLLGELLFWGTALFALFVYWFSAPVGLPWGESTAAACGVCFAGKGGGAWGYLVRIFAGHHVLLACVMAAAAAGFIAALVNRYFGWRAAVAAAVTWTFMPGLWNGVMVGDRRVTSFSAIVIGLWIANAIALRIFAKARAVNQESGDAIGSVDEKRGKWNRIVSWIFLGAAGTFAVGSLLAHDWNLGDVATAYAKDVVAEANGRWIVLNGVADDQLSAIAYGGGGVPMGSEVRDSAFGGHLVAVRNDDAYRAYVIELAKREWPGETNLWTAAQIGPSSFVTQALRRHPEKFYLMTGASTTLDGWKRRWERMAPYLKSRDRFVPVMRRAFGFEGNALANKLQDEAKPAEAWKLYRRIYGEIDPGNVSALFNMSEMMRLGHKPSAADAEKVNKDVKDFVKAKRSVEHVRFLVRSSGPVRADKNMLAKLEAEARKHVEAKRAAGEKVEIPERVKTLVEWNNDMVKAMDAGDLAKAGRIARAILSHDEWSGFIPANAVLGAVTAHDGDYVASETFFRAAVSTTNQVPAVTCNDFADTLMHLGKLDEAEKFARRAVATAGPKCWLERLTLAEILFAAKRTDEVNALAQEIRRNVPREIRADVDEKLKSLGAAK